MSTKIVAEWMIRNGYVTGHGDSIEDLLEELREQIIKDFKYQFRENSVNKNGDK